MDVIEVDDKYRSLANYLLGNVFIAESEDALTNSNGSIVLEKHGKYVKGKYSLTGGSVGFLKAKKLAVQKTWKSCRRNCRTGSNCKQPESGDTVQAQRSNWF